MHKAKWVKFKSKVCMEMCKLSITSTSFLLEDVISGTVIIFASYQSMCSDSVERSLNVQNDRG